MSKHNRHRSTSIDRASVEAILTSGETSHPLASPNPHVGNSPNRAHFAMSPPPRPAVKHARALSYTSRRPNRLSLSFPVATGNTSDSSRPTPTSSNASSFPPTPIDAPIVSPDDANSFLVAVASQERKVLELKEELSKAEKELIKLKTKWAAHERNKKRAEIRHIEPLRPLQALATEGARSSEDADDGSRRQSIEIDRRKALLSHLPKEPRRKVFSGGHQRTLSLLSPDRSNYTRPFPPVEESGLEGDGLPRSTTMPDTSQGITKIGANRANRHSYQGSYQGAVTHNAKQIAEDVKAGLWTFLEDLRQATVGDEATTTQKDPDAAPHGPKKKGSKSSLLSNGKVRRGQSPRDVSPRTWDSLTGPAPGLGLSDTAGNFWPESTPSKPLLPGKSRVKRPLSLAPAIDDLDDNWSNWDSPDPNSTRWSGSTELSDPPTPSHSKDEDRAVKIMDATTGEGTPSRPRGEIQWPALDNLTPGNLKRTVSTIMKEWEKSLTPPAENQDQDKTASSAASDNSATSKKEERSVSQMTLL